MDLLPWLTALTHLQEVAELSALVIFIMTPKAGRKNFLIIGVMLAFIVVIELGSWIAHDVFHVNPNVINHAYNLFIVPAFYFFYVDKIHSDRIKNRFLLLTITFLLFASINMIFFQGLTSVSSYTMAFRCVILIIFSSIYFGVLATELPRQVYVGLPIFWINCAVVTYFSILLPIHLFTDYIYLTLKLSIIPLWMVHNFVGVVYYSFVSVGLWRNRSLYTLQSSLHA
ncbi:MAG: hypothetical protein WDO15_12545 [Bacteroidota bacterium]